MNKPAEIEQKLNSTGQKVGEVVTGAGDRAWADLQPVFDFAQEAIVLFEDRAFEVAQAAHVLQLEDDALVGMNARSRCGLLCAVSVLLETLSMDVQGICEQQRKAKGGAA